MARSRYTFSHRACLVAPHRRAEYALRVQDWLEQVLPLYAAGNVKRTGFGYVAQDDNPPQFEYVAGEGCCWSLRPACPSQLLLVHKGSYAKARRQIMDLALNLLREARPADQRQLRQRIKDERL